MVCLTICFGKCVVLEEMIFFISRSSLCSFAFDSVEFVYFLSFSLRIIASRFILFLMLLSGSVCPAKRQEVFKTRVVNVYDFIHICRQLRGMMNVFVC